MITSFSNYTLFKRFTFCFLMICNASICSLANTDIIGDIWEEQDLDGMYDGTGGVSGVTVLLIDSESLSTISSTVSASGKFEFLGVPPGKYILQIPASQFAAGAVLDGYLSCLGFTPADDMIDNNDNGADSAPLDVRTSEFSLTDNSPNSNVVVDYIDFCFIENNCSEENPFASNTCDEILDADLICDINTLGSFCNTLSSDNSGGNQPSPLCPDNDGEAENISWFKFVAFAGNYTISIDPISCETGIGFSGIQAGIYKDCSFDEPIFCSTDCNTSAVDISSSLLTPGQSYYLFIDGCNGSVCTYDIDIVGTPLFPTIIPDKVCVNNNGSIECDNVDYCIDGDIIFEVSGVDLEANYIWTITTISGSPYTGNTVPVSIENKLQIEFSSMGEYEVCLNKIDNGCSDQEWSGNLCVTVNTLSSIPFVGDEEFSDQFVCVGDEDSFDINELNSQDPNNDGVFGWQGSTQGFDLGENTTTVLTPGCSYNQSFSLDTYSEEPPTGVYLAICGQDLPLQIEDFILTQESFADNDIITVDSVLSQTPNQNGCDSIINYAIEKLDIVDGFMNEPECTFNSLILDFDYNDQESTNAIFLNFLWTDPFGNALFDSQGNDQTDIEVPFGSPSGIYTLTITIVKNGFSCNYVYPVVVDFSNITPPSPTISGVSFVCVSSNSEVTYMAEGGDPSFDYIWTVPDDVSSSSTSGVMDNMLTVNWAGSNGGEITLQSENECGFSETVSLNVTVVQVDAPEFDLVSEVCIGEEVSVSSTGNDVGIVSYIWNFDGAQVTSGSITSMGPNVLSWATPGPKTVTLRTTHSNGCSSEVVSKMIEVVEPILPAQVICQTTINDILFTWQPESDIDYTVEVITGQTGVFEGNSGYRVSGLSAGETVTIELIQTPTSGVCLNPISTTSTCTAQDCPIISISLSSDQMSFCDNEPGEFQINAIVTSEVNGTGIFLGPGIVNPTGIFDPKEADIGINTITYTFIDEYGCSEMETIDLTVKASPMSGITVDQTTICIGESLQLAYNGTPGVDMYDWQNDEISISGIANPTVEFETTGVKTISLSVTKDDCVSEISTIEITVEDLPVASFIFDKDTICLSDEVQLTYTGSGNVDNYAWDLGIGNVDNIPNPSVGFIFPGEKTIELIVSSGDCVSEVFSQSLFVDAPLEPIHISCVPSSGQIEFVWNAIQGASSYEVSINGESSFITSMPNAIVEDLSNEEEVEISVIAISDGQCPNIQDVSICTALVNSTSDSELNPAVLYPNPVNSILFVDDLGDMKNYTVLDINGRVILKGIYKDGIDTQMLTDRLYILKLTSDDLQKSQLLKFLKY